MEDRNESWTSVEKKSKPCAEVLTENDSGGRDWREWQGGEQLREELNLKGSWRREGETGKRSKQASDHLWQEKTFTSFSRTSPGCLLTLSNH